MSETPDLGRIVNMIMENPALVEQISAMARAGAGESSEHTEEIIEPPSAQVSAGAKEGAPHSEKRVHRARLASAIKPYLSPERAKAIDTMLGIADIIEMTGGRS